MLPVNRTTQPSTLNRQVQRGAFTPRADADQPLSPLSAVIYCEGQFGRPDGKTAHGLIRHSDRYRILSVVDSTNAGKDAGVVLTRALTEHGIRAAFVGTGQIALIEAFAGAPVIGITLNHEGMTPADIDAAVESCQAEHGLPTTDPLLRPAQELVDMALAAFPELRPGGAA